MCQKNAKKIKIIRNVKVGLQKYMQTETEEILRIKTPKDKTFIDLGQDMVVFYLC